MLAGLLLLLPLLWLLAPAPAPGLRDMLGFMDGATLGALCALMILSRGLEVSGALGHLARALLDRVRGPRGLATLLVLLSALLAALLTNDVALFIVVPLTVGMRGQLEGLAGRLVIFEALAVNAGSAGSPVGNPQNLYLWQTSGEGFVPFALGLLPLGVALVVLLLVLVPFAFPRRWEGGDPASGADAATAGATGATPGATPGPTSSSTAGATPGPTRGATPGTTPGTTPEMAPPLDRGLLRLALPLYPVVLLLVEMGFALPAAGGALLLFGLRHRHVLRGVDWPLLAVFALFFMNVGVLSTFPVVSRGVDGLLALPGGAYTAGILTSQVISNVPAALLLDGFTTQTTLLAWGVNVGGFGLAVGSLANLIALRLGREPGLFWRFHLWSIPVLLLSTLVGWLLVRGFSPGG